MTADTCIVRLSSQAPRQILLLTHTTSQSGECLGATLLRSEDSGDSWALLTPSRLIRDGNPLVRCDTWASGPYLYWYEADSCQAKDRPPCDELLRSTDNGASWRHADSGLTTGFFDPIWTNAGAHYLGMDQ
jgi:hypothetical protein